MQMIVRMEPSVSVYATDLMTGSSRTELSYCESENENEHWNFVDHRSPTSKRSLFVSFCLSA